MRILSSYDKMSDTLIESARIKLNQCLKPENQTRKVHNGYSFINCNIQLTPVETDRLLGFENHRFIPSKENCLVDFYVSRQKNNPDSAVGDICLFMSHKPQRSLMLRTWQKITGESL